MSTSLKTMMLCAVALVLTAMVSVFLVVDVLDDMATARERVTGDARRIATVGAPLVLGALVVDDLATAEQALRAMNVDQTLAVLRLMGPDGAKMLDASPPTIRLAAAPSWFRAVLAVELPEIHVSVDGGGVIYGTIVVAPATHAVEDEAWSRVRGTAIEAAVLLVLLILAIERTLAWGLRPIHDLEQAATRFGRGDLTARTMPTRIAEVFNTANAFNAMADQLQGLLGELRSKDAANRRLAAAVQQSDEAIVTLDTDRRITAWNGGAEQLSGISAAQAMGQPLAMLVRNRPPAEQAAWVEWVITASPSTPFESSLTASTGERIDVAASATALTDEAGAPAGWAVFLRDVTARRRSERRLAEAKQQAELANRSKSEFLANMSHELRTPLNAVIGFSQVMKDEMFGALGNARYRDYAGDIHASGEHLLALINDLLDVSAIEAEKLELHDAEIDPSALADATVRLVQQRAVTGQIALQWLIADDVPLIRADPRRLKQMLLNLLTNAVKFTPAGGRVALRIIRTAESTLELTVEDNGIGMDAAGLDKAFERFGQVDGGLARRHEGTGLGLPLTKGLAELHGGSLRIDSARGVGTRATIVLPAERLLPLAAVERARPAA